MVSRLLKQGLAAQNDRNNVGDVEGYKDLALSFANLMVVLTDDHAAKEEQCNSAVYADIDNKIV